jgi:hypothetical protein
LMSPAGKDKKLRGEDAQTESYCYLGVSDDQFFLGVITALSTFPLWRRMS